MLSGEIALINAHYYYYYYYYYGTEVAVPDMMSILTKFFMVTM